ncbi:SOS response-associated peptidase [Aquabacterium sp.]|uniref:SOS response-associated peptidase n=1 Tax=Aquabacterium sp. TaxID=1872578 RepID=UPI00345C5F7A
MSSNFRPTGDTTRLRQHFGVNLPNDMHWPEETWPVDLAPVIRRAEGAPGSRELFLGQFGLLPFWAKDPTQAKRTFNARAETADEKSAFRDAWRRGQRCLIPADWVYEPCYETGRPVRWRVARADGAPMTIAGLWSRWWTAHGAEVLSFAMLTVSAEGHQVMQRFQKPEDDRRMVVVLDDSQQDAWLDCPPDQMKAMLQPCPADWLIAEEAPMVARQRA